MMLERFGFVIFVFLLFFIGINMFFWKLEILKAQLTEVLSLDDGCWFIFIG